ncbi:PGPGW domain-containing protein [bacterium]|nr:PGPGW domain-containing protein [bacterium]
MNATHTESRGLLSASWAWVRTWGRQAKGSSADREARRRERLRREIANGGWEESPTARLAVGGFRQVRKLIVLIVGSVVVLAGLVMIFTPGPAIIVIPAGIAILGIEFAWARRLLRRVRAKIEDLAKKRRAKKS